MSAPTFRDYLVVFQARAQRIHQRLARGALERGDRVDCRYHLRASRQAAKLVRAIAADCEREAATEAAWLAERASLPMPEVADSDFGEYEALAQAGGAA